MAHEMPEDIDDLDDADLRILIATVIKGRRTKDDAARANKEARDASDLHREKKGDSKPPKVEKGDIPFDLVNASKPDETPSDEDDDEDDEEESNG